jgi:hypothetical protein
MPVKWSVLKVCAAIDTVKESNMNKVLRKSESLEGTVTVTLSKIILLLELCLQLVDRNYTKGDTKGDTIRFDIQRLRDKLSHESGGK